MPGPLNIIQREYADLTRTPAGGFARALSTVYTAIAEIEANQLGSAETDFLGAADALVMVIDQMASLPEVRDRWSVQEPELFAQLTAQFAELSGVTPIGDRSMLDVLLTELRALKAALGEATDLPQTSEGQAHFLNRLLQQVIRVQQIALVATQISLVTSHT